MKKSILFLSSTRIRGFGEQTGEAVFGGANEWTNWTRVDTVDAPGISASIEYPRRPHPWMKIHPRMSIPRRCALIVYDDLPEGSLSAWGYNRCADRGCIGDSSFFVRAPILLPSIFANTVPRKWKSRSGSAGPDRRLIGADTQRCPCNDFGLLCEGARRGDRVTACERIRSTWAFGDPCFKDWNILNVQKNGTSAGRFDAGGLWGARVVSVSIILGSSHLRAGLEPARRTGPSRSRSPGNFHRILRSKTMHNGRAGFHV